MKNLIIRMAEETDAEEILAIYAFYITKTPITFECEIPSIIDFKKRIREISSGYPFLVCLIDGKIVGYAYAHKQMERAAYQWNAELSAYLDENFVSLGIGKALCNALLEILKLQNIQNVYGGVTSPNIKSENLHRSLGFELLGVYHNTGYKCNKWHDVMWFEKHIGNHELEPLAFKKIGNVNGRIVNDILNKNCELIMKGKKYYAYPSSGLNG